MVLSIFLGIRKIEKSRARFSILAVVLRLEYHLSTCSRDYYSVNIFHIYFSLQYFRYQITNHFYYIERTATAWTQYPLHMCI